MGCGASKLGRKVVPEELDSSHHLSPAQSHSSKVSFLPSTGVDGPEPSTTSKKGTHSNHPYAALMQYRSNIRHCCVMGAANQGKSTFVSSLASISEVLHMDQQVSKEKLCTPFALAHWVGATQYLLQLIDTPDYSQEMLPALYASDGALVLLDVTQGFNEAVEVAFKHCAAFKIKPLLVINKMDKLLEQRFTGEQVHEVLQSIVNQANTCLRHLAELDETGDGLAELKPEEGEVCFCSTQQGWALTLTNAAKIYATKAMGVDFRELRKQFWGDHFVDLEKKQWFTTPTEQSVRGFAHYVWGPIERIYKACYMPDGSAMVQKLLQHVGATDALADEELQFQGVKLLQTAMSKWIPIQDAALDMIVQHVPSPKYGQHHRLHALYSGPKDDKYAKGISLCDQDGPLMMFVFQAQAGPSKMMFARVFSGKLTSAKVLRFMGPKYMQGNQPSGSTSKDMVISSAGDILLWFGKTEEVPCANMCVLPQINSLPFSMATVTEEEFADACPFRCIDMEALTPPSRRLSSSMSSKMSSDNAAHADGAQASGGVLSMTSHSPAKGSDLERTSSALGVTVAGDPGTASPCDGTQNNGRHPGSKSIRSNDDGDDVSQAGYPQPTHEGGEGQDGTPAPDSHQMQMGHDHTEDHGASDTGLPAGSPDHRVEAEASGPGLQEGKEEDDNILPHPRIVSGGWTSTAHPVEHVPGPLPGVARNDNGRAATRSTDDACASNASLNADDSSEGVGVDAATGPSPVYAKPSRGGGGGEDSGGGAANMVGGPGAMVGTHIVVKPSHSMGDGEVGTVVGDGGVNAQVGSQCDCAGVLGEGTGQSTGSSPVLLKTLSEKNRYDGSGEGGGGGQPAGRGLASHNSLPSLHSHSSKLQPLATGLTSLPPLAAGGKVLARGATFGNTPVLGSAGPAAASPQQQEEPSLEPTSFEHPQAGGLPEQL